MDRASKTFPSSYLLPPVVALPPPPILSKGWGTDQIQKRGAAAGEGRLPKSSTLYLCEQNQVLLMYDVWGPSPRFHGRKNGLFSAYVTSMKVAFSLLLVPLAHRDRSVLMGLCDSLSSWTTLAVYRLHLIHGLVRWAPRRKKVMVKGTRALQSQTDLQLWQPMARAFSPMAQSCSVPLGLLA